MLNKNKDLPFKKFLFIGLSLFAFKAVLLVFAYTLSADEYNLFNKAYYTASLIILFGSFGFNISLTQLALNRYYVLLLISINAVIAAAVIYFLSAPSAGILKMLGILIYCVFVSAGGVLNFKLLFEGDYLKYSLILLSLTGFHLLIIPGITVFGISVFILLPVIAVTWFTLTVGFFESKTAHKFSLIEFYKIGYSAFVINSAVSLGLAADKFIANHFFTIDIANSYTFAWSLTAPLFYIGTLIEKFLYSESNYNKKHLLVRGFIYSVSLVLIYTVSSSLIINNFPSLLPDSISSTAFKNIFIFMITGYAVYVIFHFPINAYLFKSVGSQIQKSVAVFFTFIILIFGSVFFYIAKNAHLIEYKMLLLGVWIYIFILLSVKSFIIFKTRNNDNKDIVPAEESIQNIP